MIFPVIYKYLVGYQACTVTIIYISINMNIAFWLNGLSGASMPSVNYHMPGTVFIFQFRRNHNIFLDACYESSGFKAGRFNLGLDHPGMIIEYINGVICVSLWVISKGFGFQNCCIINNIRNNERRK